MQSTLEAEFQASKTWEGKASDWLSSKWGGFKSPRQLSRIQQTGYKTEALRDIGVKMCTLPETLTVHKQLKKIIDLRMKTIVEGKGIDWGTAEALAFGTLLLEGNHVRLSGQDVERGTFSHRHAALVDQKNRREVLST